MALGGPRGSGLDQLFVSILLFHCYFIFDGLFSYFKRSKILQFSFHHKLVFFLGN